MTTFETRIGDILASKDFLSKHPGSSQLGSDLYSSAINSTSEIILRSRAVGRYVSNATTLAFGSQASFFLTPGSILNGIVISGSVILNQFTRAPQLWALNALDSIELVISGSSSIQSLKINSRTHMDMIMATMSTEKMNAVKSANNYIDLSAAGATVYFSIPLHLFFSSIENKAVFSLDSSTLQSQIIVNLRWKPNYEIFSSDGVNAIVLPSGFNTLYLRVGDQIDISNDFSLARELRADPQMIYSIPGTYLQSFVTTETISAVGPSANESSITLTSMPSGQLMGMLVSARAVATKGSANHLTLIKLFAEFETIRMLYNGTEYYRADSKNELRLFNAQSTCQDAGLYNSWLGHSVVTPGAKIVEYKAVPTILIPFSNQFSEVLRDRRHEHCRDFSGTSLQFFYRIASGTDYNDDTNPISGGALSPLANPAGVQYEINFTFINAGLYEIGQQSVSLQM